MYWIWASDTTGLLSCWDLYRRCWNPTLCVTITDGWADGVWPNTAGSIFTHWQTGSRQTAWHEGHTARHTDRHSLFPFCFILIHIKLLWCSAAPALLFTPQGETLPPLFSESSYAVDVVVAIVVVAVNPDISPVQSFWSYYLIIMASDCKVMPRASLHLIMRWFDWCQMNTSNVEEKQLYFQNNHYILSSVIDFGWLGKILVQKVLWSYQNVIFSKKKNKNSDK